MKSRLLLSAFFMFAFLANVFSQIHNYVGIVHGDYSPETSAFLSRLQKELESEGYISQAKIIESHQKGVGGSGFVYVGEDGSNYILTNNHVIAQASTYSFEIHSPNGSSKKYEGLKVVAIDEELDLAILSFSGDQRPFSKGLKFYAESLEDGQDIWSAGFPSIGESQLWQLGKGTITNSMARVPDLISPDLTTLIQHSAQVDPGNSGGPLMIKADKSTGGYLVVGINTWKALNRQATNYSIPSRTILRFLKNALSTRPNAKDDLEEGKKRVNAFIQSCTTKSPAYKDIATYISNEYVRLEGEEALIRTLRTSPSIVRSHIEYVFVTSSPIEAMRLSIAYDIQRVMEKIKTPISLSLTNIEKDPNSGKLAITFDQEGEMITSSWQFENGICRLLSFSKNQEKKEDDIEKSDMPDVKQDKKKTSVKKDRSTSYTSEKPYTILLMAGYNPVVSGDIGDQFEGSFAVSFARVVGITVIYQYLSDEIDDFSYTFHDIIPSVRLKYPLNFTRFNITPYVQCGMGLCFLSGDMESFGITTDFRGGLIFGLDAGLPVSLFAGIAYTIQELSYSDDYSLYDLELSGNSLSLTVGIGL